MDEASFSTRMRNSFRGKLETFLDFVEQVRHNMCSRYGKGGENRKYRLVVYCGLGTVQRRLDDKKT